MADRRPGGGPPRFPLIRIVVWGVAAGIGMLIGGIGVAGILAKGG